VPGAVPRRARRMSDAGEEVFRRRAVVALVATSAVSFLVALVFSLFGEHWGNVATASTATYSRSAIGHAALVELLKSLDRRVVVSRFESGGKAGADSLLVFAEPLDEVGEYHRYFHAVAGPARRVLLVLPKWRGVVDPAKPAFVMGATPVDTDEVEEVLAWALLEASVVRPVLVESPRWRSDRFAAVPTLASPQLLTADADSRIMPLLWCDSGLLVGRLRSAGRDLYVLSDPDLLSNHGLGAGRNAALAIELFAEAGANAPAIVFDETMHGFELRPSLWAELFRFPLVLVLMHALAVLALLLWAAMGRFGRPRPLPPPHAAGNRFLIENTAALLRFGGHSNHVLGRYLATAMQEAAQATPPPGHVGPQELPRWLEEVERARGRGGRLAALREEVGARGRRRESDLLKLAGRIHRWREEWTHGT